MDDELLARVAADLVLAGWDQQIQSVEPLGGGMNSATALVGLGGERSVLKWVPQRSAGALGSGCQVAQLLARHGLLTGDPIPTAAGELTFLTHRGLWRCSALSMVSSSIPQTPVIDTTWVSRSP